MKKILMNNRGITLMSLVIYVTIMFVVLALIMRVTIYYTKNISDVADTSLETEFEKLNMYMLQETKKTNNYVLEVAEDRTSITFSDGNKFEFIKENGAETGQIYFNSTMLCKNINSCSFDVLNNEETEKAKITLIITITGKSQIMTYTVTRTDENGLVINENDYIMNTRDE